MSTNKFTHQKFEFDNDESIEVIHNIDDIGSSVNTAISAVQNWLLRTDEVTSESFCEYVNNKGIHEAYTVEQYEELTGESIESQLKRKE